MDLHTVAVIGGGVAGLAAARALAGSGVEVTLFEAGGRLGGQVRTETIAGHRVDVGAEALHLAGGDIAQLVDELDLTQDLVHARPGVTWIWTSHGLRRLPAGVGPAGPTRLVPVLGARVLSPRGLARAALEPLVPRNRSDADTSVGEFLRRRFGGQVVDRLVDPLLGTIHAGDLGRLSMRSATPQLAALAARHRSLILAHRDRAASGTPAVSFVTFPEGLSTLTTALLRGTAVHVELGAPVRAIAADTAGYHVVGPSGEVHDCDGVVLAVPAAVAARLVEPVLTGSTAPLGGVRTASVATVVAAYPRWDADVSAPLQGTGLLVPRARRRLLKAATFLSRKWPHLDEDPAVFLVRLSAGRVDAPDDAALDDDALAGLLHRDLAEATGFTTPPVETIVHRWPHALQQLEVGHARRLEAVRVAVEAHPGIVLAGASFDGLGLAACLRSGWRAAATLVARRTGDQAMR